MSYTDYAAEARSASATASNATRRAKRDAGLAAQQYARAAEAARLARQLTAHPELGRETGFFTPAHQEGHAATLTRLGDVYLRSSWRETGQAEFYRDLAGRYRALRDRRDARLVELAAECEAELARCQ
jgi:hypothetical protein